MLGSEFLATYAGSGLPDEEAAAVSLAEKGELTPWPWFDLPLADDRGNQAILKVQGDVVSVGSLEDHLRLPLTPNAAQSVLNLSGALLPTPWLVYQIWRASPDKLVPTPMVPNMGANLGQFAAHSRLIDGQIAGPDKTGAVHAVAGIKKHVVVSNIYKPGKVLLFGWYRPFPDVFDDGRPMNSPGRQPIQPRSNVHGDFYLDYSHGIQAVGPEAIVNGESMATVDLYQHPTLSRLVSSEGPVKVPRYPSRIPPKGRAQAIVSYAEDDTFPTASELGFDLFTNPERYG